MRHNWFYNLVFRRRLKVKDLTKEPLENDVWKECLRVLEQNDLSYIIAWFNNEQVILHNKNPRLIGSKWHRSWIWYVYWLKKVNEDIISDIDYRVERFKWYSVMPWYCLYRLIVEPGRYWFIWEKDFKERKRISKPVKNKGSWMTKKQKILYNQTKMYTKRIKQLMDKEELDEQENFELLSYRKKMRVPNAIKIAEAFEKKDVNIMEQIKQLAEKNNSYYDIVNEIKFS